MSAINCDHLNILENDSNGTKICVNCGLEENYLIYDIEWKNYNSPSTIPRCYISNNKIHKGFRKIIIDYKIVLHESIIALSEQKFDKVITDNKKNKEIIRDSARKALAAACCFYT